jgi:hypothetical protein
MLLWLDSFYPFGHRSGNFIHFIYIKMSSYLIYGMIIIIA